MRTLDITKTQYTVGDFVNWQKNQTLILSPSFQRRPVWKPGAKSFLIDTILRGLPIPIVFLRDQKTDLKTLAPRREVVDGQQRIRTLLSFICPQYLKDFKEEQDDFDIKRAHNKDLAGLRFNDLDEELRQKILDYQFSVHVLPSSADDREVLQLFARMNATGVKLNDQELRNANCFGEFKTLAYELAAEHLEYWRQWGIFTEYNIARMEEVELTSEFLMLMVNGVTAKTQSTIDRFYDLHDEQFPAGEEVERRFRHLMESIDDKFGNALRATPFKKKTLFYSLFASLYHLAYEIGSDVNIRKKPSSITNDQISYIRTCADRIENKAAPEPVMDATSLRTTHLSSRKTLIEYLTNKKL